MNGKSLIYFVLPIGCDYVIDKSKESLWQKAEEISPDGYDVVFDANGVATLTDSYNHLAPGGKLVVYGMALINITFYHIS